MQNYLVKYKESRYKNAFREVLSLQRKTSFVKKNLELSQNQISYKNQEA